MMLTEIHVELLKLRRSLALLLIVVAPLAICLLFFAITLDRDKALPWPMLLGGVTSIWAYFMLPMVVTALSVLLAQMEHGPRTWDHLLALPIPRWRFFASKLVATLLATAAMTMLLGIGGLATGHAVAAIRPAALLGRPDIAALATTLARMWVAASLVTLIQLWVALRLRSFVPPLIVGIGGTMVGVVAASSRQGVYFPWLLPVNMMSTPDRIATALTIALVGFAVLLPIMLFDLSRRETA